MWNNMKKGRLDWPRSQIILKYFGAMARGWLAVGVPLARVRIHNIVWLSEEEEYLLEKAGTLTLQAIANHLGRTYQAVRARLNKNHGIQSRHNQGFMSATELAKEYNCPCHRVRDALRSGEIRGRFDRKRNRWRIDPGYIMRSTAAQAILCRPKQTYKNTPTDVGDYYRRYNLKRTRIDGKTIVVPISNTEK